MRNWNDIPYSTFTDWVNGIYNTYEELKLFFRSSTSCFGNSIYNTYEELKPWKTRQSNIPGIMIYNTYEELKHSSLTLFLSKVSDL